MIPAHLALSQAYRQELVELLQKKGAIRNASSVQAFTRIPREEFVPLFYDRAKGEHEWKASTVENKEPGEWLQAMYQDRALITQLTNDIPTSSSSMPSIMGYMLEALDIQPSHRILEIGTGTGYNAALLATLVHSPTQVTTVDLDSELVHRARETLQRIVGSVHVLAGDGSQGEVSHAPYDRILVTASTSVLPRAWYQQLAPGGRLVGALQGSLGASGFLVIEKTGDGHSARGQFLDIPLHFMSLRTATPPSLPDARELFQRPFGSAVQLSPHHPFISLSQNDTFRWFAQWWWNGSIRIDQAIMTQGHQKKPIMLLMDQGHQTILQITEDDKGWWRGRHHGDFPLWRTLEQAVRQFLAFKRPEKRSYHVMLDEQEARLHLIDTDGQIHSLCRLSVP